jgi:trk system potassium uptake protein TrkH
VVVLGLSIVSAATASLFLVHFALAGGAGIGPGSAFDPAAALHALWGIWFSSLSFLTTTGYLSQDWAAAAAWSGTTAPGLVLAGLAMMGGGIATTAGGVKLLRLAALVRHGEREVERLIHPSSVGGSGADVRRLRREGALAAWVFFMLFAVSITATMLLLGLGGLGFEDATIVAVSALTNTGPLAPAAGAGSTVWADLSGFSAFVSAAAMVIGRLETLAVIAMMDPAFWRR